MPGVPPEALLRILGTELPIIQAPMAGVQLGALAVAVSNAGGLGSLPCAMLTVETMTQGADGDSRRHGQTLQRELLLSRAAHVRA